jgi:hypothetical protein
VSTSRRNLIAAVSLITLAPMAVEGQSNVAVSPFVSYVPSAVKNPLAGMSLTFGGTTGLALRGSADLSISNPDKRDSVIGGAGAIGGYRPWAADADAILFLGGLGGGATVFSRTLAPYLFSGIGLTGGDSAGNNVVHNGWSYGAGATIPLGLDADLFAEARWRMSQYVLPTSKNAPDSKSELRFGLSFHVGGGSEPAPRPRRRHRMDNDYDDDVAVAPVVVAPTPAPAPAPQVIVVQPAPAPAPVIVMPAPEPEPSTTINVNLPGSIIYSPRRSRRARNDVVVISRPVQATATRVGVVYRRVEELVCSRGNERRSSSCRR